MNRPLTHRELDWDEIQRRLADIDNAPAHRGDIPAEAHDRGVDGHEGWWLFFGAAAALGWIGGLLLWGVIG